jgi:RNA polymerase sigma factor (sigma-70 family)
MDWLDQYGKLNSNQLALVEKFYPWSRKYLSEEIRYRRFELSLYPELEDALENASLKALYKTAKNFDPDRGTKFQTLFHLNWRGAKVEAQRQVISSYKKFQNFINNIFNQTDKFDIASNVVIDNESENQQLELIQIILSQLNRLAERDKVIFQKSFWEGKTDPEIGNEIGYTKANVWQRKDRALKRIRRAMGAHTRSSRVA